MAIVVSTWKIQFIAPNGAVTLLLDYGDDMDSEFELGTEQQTTGYSAIGALWGGNTSDMGVTSQTMWTRRQIHSSPQATRSYQMMHPMLMPYGKKGTLRFSIQGGAVWDRLASVVQSCVCKVVPRVPHATLSAYVAKLGRAIPVSGVTPIPGFPHEWRLVAHEAQTGTHENL